MLSLKNEGRRSMFIDSRIPIEIKTTRPPTAGAYERLEDGDVLLVNVGYDLEVTVRGDTLVIRPYNAGG